MSRSADDRVNSIGVRDVNFDSYPSARIRRVGARVTLDLFSPAGYRDPPLPERIPCVSLWEPYASMRGPQKIQFIPRETILQCMGHT